MYVFFATTFQSCTFLCVTGSFFRRGKYKYSPLSILKIKSEDFESGLLACGKSAQGADNR